MDSLLGKRRLKSNNEYKLESGNYYQIKGNPHFKDMGMKKKCIEQITEEGSSKKILSIEYWDK